MPSSSTTLSGFLFRPAELRRTQGGTAILSFTLPDENGYGDKKTTQWVRCSIFGKQAESLANHLVKGSGVQVTGHMQARTYEKDGETRVSLDMNVDSFSFLNAPKAKGDAPADDGWDAGSHSGHMDDEISF